MKAFTTLCGLAAPLPQSDIDTDVIFPARFLLLLDKIGLGKVLFNERRYDAKGQPQPDFVLNREPYDKACILVAGARFGSGSSREQAVWALADFGITCVIAPSFGEIFHANCFKNGVLPITLGPQDHALAMAAAEAGRVFTVDLSAGRVDWQDGSCPFTIEEFRRQALMDGLDEIGLVLKSDEGAIAAFEASWRERAPWLVIGDRSKDMLREDRDER